MARPTSKGGAMHHAADGSEGESQGVRIQCGDHDARITAFASESYGSSGAAGVRRPGMTPADLAVEHHFIDLPTLRMHYVTAGTGPMVVLLHGFPENWWSWRHQIKPLADAGFRVVAPDLRGYGATDKNGPFDLDTIAGDVCHLISSFGGEKKVRIVGHDWGGATAWHLAAERSEFCERLAVLNCPPTPVMREVMVKRLNLRQLAKSWYMFFFQLPVVPEWVLTRNDAGAVVAMIRGSAIDKTNFSVDELRPFRDDIQRPGAAKAMVDWYRTSIRAGLFKPPTLTPISVETLLIWGMKDKALGYDDVVPGIEKYAPKLRIERIENAGHFVHADAPAVVNEKLLAFLR